MPGISYNSTRYVEIKNIGGDLRELLFLMNNTDGQKKIVFTMIVHHQSINKPEYEHVISSFLKGRVCYGSTCSM